MPETHLEKVDRILRDHEGYTGDGKGGVGALPIGDRSTSRKPIDKRDLREIFKAHYTVIDEARDQALGAAAIATSAAGVKIRFFPTADALGLSEIPPEIDVIQLDGLETLGDGLGGVYVRAGAGGVGYIQDATGAFWAPAKSELDAASGEGGRTVLAASSTTEAADLLAIARSEPQRSLGAGTWVADASDVGARVTNFNGGTSAYVDARALEYTKSYTFRCYPLSANTLKVDFGEGMTIAGFQGSRGFELLPGQSVTVTKATDGVVYLESEYAPVYRVNIDANSYYEPTEAGEYRYVRKVSVNAGATTLALPSVFHGNSQTGWPRVVGLTTRRSGASAADAVILTSVADTAIAVHNPNSEAVEITVVIEGLRQWPTTRTNTDNHFRVKIPPLEATRQLLRDFSFITVGQSLASAYANRGNYKALDQALRDGGELAEGHHLDLINTAAGGSFADKASSTNPAETNYWYDVTGSANGPLLTAALAKISAAYSAGKTPQFIIVDLGQAEAIALEAGRNTKARYKTAMEAILSALAAAAPSVPIYFQTLSGRKSASVGSQMVRDVQLDLIATNANVAGAVDGYDAQLIDEVHPTEAGYKLLGRRIGELHCGDYNPPEIVSAVRAAGGTHITLTLSKAITAPVGSKIMYAGGRANASATASSILDGEVMSSTTIRLTPNRGSSLTNLLSINQVLWPRNASALNVAEVFPGSVYALDASGNPIRSAVVDVT